MDPDRLASQHALALAYQANGQVKEAVTLRCFREAIASKEDRQRKAVNIVRLRPLKGVLERTGIVWRDLNLSEDSKPNACMFCLIPSFSCLIFKSWVASNIRRCILTILLQVVLSMTFHLLQPMPWFCQSPVLTIRDPVRQRLRICVAG